MADSEKMPVSVYQLDLSSYDGGGFNDIIEDILKRINKEGERFTESRVNENVNPDFQVRVYSSFRVYHPKWTKFLGPVLHRDAALKHCQNQTNSFICFIGYKGQIFAVTGGLGSFALDRFISQNFGLEILVRLFKKDSKVIKYIQDRGVTGMVLGQSRFYRGDQRLSDENDFGKIFKQVKADLDKTILTKIFGFAEGDLRRAKSGCLAKSSFQINKAIDFATLSHLIKRFTEILGKEENFALNKVHHVSRRNPANDKLIKELTQHLLEVLYHDCKSGKPLNVDFCHRDYEKYLTASMYTVAVAEDEDIHFENPPSLDEIIEELKQGDNYLDATEFEFKNSVLDRVLTTTDEDDKFLTQGKVGEHLHGELVYQRKNYFFVDGEWYLIHPAFIKDLNNECAAILKQCWDEKLVTEEFDINDRESNFNIKFINRKGWYVLDTITPENIELCDLLHTNDNGVHLIHVKKAFDNSVRDLAAQVLISAKRIHEDIKSGFGFIDQVEQRVKKGLTSDSEFKKKLGGQSFPDGGLREIFASRLDGQIVFCLAFADTASGKRILKTEAEKFESNIAKYSLISLRREINSMGFGFKVIQLVRADV